jgi:general secretion pathway protein M
MIAALRLWWTQLSARERLLVGVAGGMTVLVMLWLIIRSFGVGLADGAEAQRQALAQAARIEAKLALLAQPKARTTKAVLAAGPLDQAVAQSATDAGLTLTRNEARGDKGAVIAIAAARAPALIGWLASLEDSGVIVDRLNISPGTDSSVAMTAELRRP